MLCVAIIDDNTVFIGGGQFGKYVKNANITSPYIDQICLGGTGVQGTYDDTYFLDLNTEQYTAGPKLQVPRFRHTCHYVKATNEIIIAGGQLNWQNNTCTDLVYKSVEIIDLNTTPPTIRYGNDKSNYEEQMIISKFIPGNDLPTRQYRQSFLRYQDTFLMLGGKTCPDSACVEGCGCDDDQCVEDDHILRQV